MERLKIGQLAFKAGVNITTIRYYERRGLIPIPARTSSGYRQYPPDTVRRIIFIRSAQELGFSLGEIKGLLTLRLSNGDQCEKVRARAEKKIEEIEEKIKNLNNIKNALLLLIE